MNKKGETLLEVLVALTLIVVTAAAAASAVISATKSLSLSKNYLIAQNLGSEALEAIKNIRDTNWMKFPINKEDCWLVIDEITEAGYCGTSEKLQYIVLLPSNDYIVKFENNKWVAEKQTTTIESSINNFALRNTGGKYTSAITADSPLFYRAIRVMNEDSGKSITIKSITIKAIVKWYEGSKLYTVEGTEILTNYLE